MNPDSLLGGALLYRNQNVKDIYFSMRTMGEVPDASREIERIVSMRHRPNSVYKATNLAELLTTAARIANALTLVLMARQQSPWPWAAWAL